RVLVALAFRNSSFVPVSPSPSPAVLAFAFALSLATGILFGASPSWLAPRADSIDALRGSGFSRGSHSYRAHASLLVVQAALSVVLVAASIMLARSLANLQQQNFGYPARGRVLAGLK